MVKVKELIEKLKEYDEDMPVWFIDTQFVNCYFEIQNVYAKVIAKDKVIPGTKVEYNSIGVVILDIE